MYKLIKRITDERCLEEERLNSLNNKPRTTNFSDELNHNHRIVYKRLITDGFLIGKLTSQLAILFCTLLVRKFYLFSILNTRLLFLLIISFTLCFGYSMFYNFNIGRDDDNLYVSLVLFEFLIE